MRRRDVAHQLRPVRAQPQQREYIGEHERRPPDSELEIVHD
jgi:hypothetical protein